MAKIFKRIKASEVDTLQINNNSIPLVCVNPDAPEDEQEFRCAIKSTQGHIYVVKREA